MGQRFEAAIKIIKTVKTVKEKFPTLDKFDKNDKNDRDMATNYHPKEQPNYTITLLKQMRLMLQSISGYNTDIALFHVLCSSSLCSVEQQLCRVV